MDTDHHHQGSDNSNSNNNFGPPSWMEVGDMNSSQHSPTLPDFHSMGYGSHPIMPLDPSYGLSIPPPYASLPLTVPSHQWPSLIATQSHFPDSGLPSHTQLPGVSQVAPQQSGRKSSTSSAAPRRTLTDEDRRRMCLYHEEHKTAKQTDIGALFGVERSTVSKVLRQKEKYLNAEDTTRSPIKRTKGRVPDIEKALSNWARNYQKQGFPLADAQIREKAMFFASTCGSPDGKERVLTTRWLEKFKQKHILGSKSRKSSFASAKSDSTSPSRLSINSALASAVQSPTLISPTSPTGFISPTSLSPTQSHENIKTNLAESLADLAEYQRNNKNITSPDTTASSLSPGVTSPTSLMSDPFSPATDANKPRNEAFPFGTVDPNMISEQQQQQQQQQHQQSPLEQHQPHPLSLPILESPFEEHHNTNTVPDHSNTVKRNRSHPEIKARPIYPAIFSKSATVSPISPPGSPTQDEARQALELVMNYFQQQPAGLCAQEYFTMGKLMERLDLAKNQSHMLPGGFTRIEEHNDPTSQMNRKRSIHGLV